MKPSSKVIYRLYLLLFLFFIGCAGTKKEAKPDISISDKNESPVLTDFCSKLVSRLNDGIMLGHKDALAYGSMWYNQPGRSDVKSVCGNYPALVNWDLGNIETGSALNVDSIPFNRIKNYVEQFSLINGVTAFEWNPTQLYPKGAEDDTVKNRVRTVFPGNKNYDAYIRYLDKLASFLSGIKNKEGEYIPVILHLFASPNSIDRCCGMEFSTSQEYIGLWHLTVDYLRNTQNMHHILYAYSIYDAVSEDEIKRYYPGDAYVDIIGLNLYQDFEKDETGVYYKQRLDMGLSAITSFARKHKKIPALTDTGLKGVKISNYFSSVLDPVISKYKLSYVIFGPNTWNIEECYYIPIPGHPASEDFSKFARSSHIITCEKKDLVL